MIRTIIAATALLAATPIVAQDAQEPTRYDRALAAGYKALMLCGAIGNAERNGTTRTPESVHQWELTGIQSPLDQLVQNLPYQIRRQLSENPTGTGFQILSVEVEWADDMAPRIAKHNSLQGCQLYPIGGSYPPVDSVRMQKQSRIEVFPWGAERISLWQSRHLAEEMTSAIDGTYGERARTTAVVVKRGGAVSEHYADGFVYNTPQRTWSVAKSIAATLLGAAVLRGEVDIEASAGLGESEADPRRAITLDHLLRMASGRYSDTPGNRTDPIYWGGATVDERAATWPLIHPPGTVFRYANNDTLMAVKAIAPTFEEHPPAEFFAKLGMDSTVAETDWQGNYIFSSQVWSTARDLARLGQLYLDDGVLPNGERILPENWREYVSSPSGPQPEGRDFGYGAGFWLMNQSEGVPPDTFAAFGNRGQYVVIVPSRDVVIVRRGEDPVGSRFDIAAFTRDVLAALEE